MQRNDWLRDKLEQAIGELNFKKEPEELYEPISYTLQGNGKRIRPYLTLLACNMFSEKIDDAIYPAIGLEVFHNFTLLHDDIMDNAPVRRGLPTVHEKWSANTAILSGDAMMVEAYKLICKAPSHTLSKVLEVFSDTALGVCEGQMFDMQFEKQNNVSESEYLEMIRLKTSVLLAGSLKVGAIIGGASDKDAQLLYNFGLSLGLAFQLKDDWLDSFGDEAVFGKRIGGDIVENKKTYLLIKALERADKNELLALKKWIEKTDFNEQEKIESVKEIYKTLAIDELTQQKVADYSTEAFKYLAAVSVPIDAKKALMDLGEQLLNRVK
jgi:geranylgeranyl diphosphate synthase type II